MRDVNSLNKVILIGHLGGNPELRYIAQTDRAVANFSLATNERTFNPNTNESSDRTEWHKIVSWGKQAEFCEKYLSKGKQILVEGRIRTDKWQDKDGNQRYTTKIHAQNITLLGRREDSPEGDRFSESQEGGSQGISDAGSALPEIENNDEEVPF